MPVAEWIAVSRSALVATATGAALPATNGTAVRSGSMAGAHRGATGTRPPGSIGAITGTPVEPRRSGGGRSRSYQRRSAGPPGAGALGLATKASWDRVPERRGSASRVTVTRISRRGDLLRRTTMSAAPVAAPRRRPSPRKASSLTVTRGQGPRCPAPPGAPSLPASVATRPSRVNPRPPAVAPSGSRETPPLGLCASFAYPPGRRSGDHRVCKRGLCLRRVSSKWPSSGASSAPLGDPCACTGTWPGDRLTMPATRPRGAGPSRTTIQPTTHRGPAAP
jgi:hypothetical protein